LTGVNDVSLDAVSEGRADLGIGALELFVEVLSQSEAGATVDGFYDHLCEAVCRLARMRRALIFRYDSADRRVRAVGAHGMDIEPFAGAYVTVESAPIAAQAIRQDRVVEVVGDLSGQVPEEFAALVSEPARLVCAPMAAADRAFGVILADRLMHEPPLQEADRRLLWTLGKAAALASVARVVSTQFEKASQLEQRIDLARELHEGVIQRLFGVSMALDGDGELPASARQRCAAETQAALTDLRAALQRPLGRAPRATRTTLAAEVKRLAVVHPHLGLSLVEGTPADVPPLLQPLAQSVLIEAVRNADKHAAPSHVHVRLGRADGAFWMEIVNDGVTGARRRAGMGLRLAALEALQSNGVVEFGERDPGIWQVRLMVPDEDDD
jgi:signal transduction histidine kinase